MTNDVFNRLKEDAYKVCVLGDYDQRTFDDLWAIVLAFEEERNRNREKTRIKVTEMRKENPNYANSVVDGKIKSFYKKKGTSDEP